MSDPHDELCPPNNPEDDELTLPRASINKIIKELVRCEFLFVGGPFSNDFFIP